MNAVEYLESTRTMFLDATAGLSDAQWRFKPAPEVWSVGECAEHVALVEDRLFAMILRFATEPPASAEDLAQVEGKEDLLVRMVTSRSRKASAPEEVCPANRWPTPELLIAHFTESRDRTIAYARAGAEGLYTHIRPHFVLGPLSGYQWLLFQAAHSERHIKQMDEVKADPGYPRGAGGHGCEPAF